MTIHRPYMDNTSLTENRLPARVWMNAGRVGTYRWRLIQ